MIAHPFFALLDESGLGHAAEEMNNALRRIGVAEVKIPTPHAMTVAH
jgi:hypothetical protein